MVIKHLGFFLLCCTSIVYAQQQEQFLHANALYHAGQYDDAFAVYQEIPQKGRAVWYNMGNCAYQVGNHTDALVYWKRAERNATWDEREDIKVNRGYALRALNKKTATQDPLFSTIVQWVMGKRPLLLFQLLCLCLWFLSLVCLRRYPRRVWSTGAIFFAVGASVCGAGMYERYRDYRHQQAYVITDRSPLYGGPNERYHKRGTVQRADLVRICAQRDEWCKVASESHVGWVPVSSVCVV